MEESVTKVFAAPERKVARFVTEPLTLSEIELFHDIISDYISSHRGKLLFDNMNDAQVNWVNGHISYVQQLRRKFLVEKLND
jgi:hypothetical protein